jgi:type 1 glutamine amidotransferase
MKISMQNRPPVLPFDHISATQKMRLVEDGWHNRNPEAVSLALRQKTSRTPKFVRIGNAACFTTPSTAAFPLISPAATTALQTNHL